MADAPPHGSRSPVLDGPLRTALFWLALPVLGEQFLVFLVDFYDTWLSGRVDASVHVTSAVGVAGYVGWLASLTFGLIGAGTTALVARHWGAGEYDDANRVTNRSLALTLVLGVGVTAAIAALAPAFAALLRSGEEGGAIVVRFLRIHAIGYPFTGVTLIAAAALRGAGNTRTPMLLLAWVSVLNVLVSRALVFGGPFAPMGGEGIVWGTVVARAVGCGLMLAVLASGTRELTFSARELRLRGRTVRRILRIGGPAAIDGALMWLGHFLFLLVIANLAADPNDNTILAAHMIGVRIEALTYLPAVAWGQAAATIVGQSLGAGQLDRARRVGHETMLQCGLLGVLATLCFAFGAHAIYEAMHDDPRVVAIGVPALQLIAWFQVPLVGSITYVQALRGAGDTRFSVVATLVGVYGVRIPLAWYCGSYLEMGLVGAWIGMGADITLRALLMAGRYARGRWDTIST